jgi:hypothetical protein
MIIGHRAKTLFGLCFGQHDWLCQDRHKSIVWDKSSQDHAFINRTYGDKL